jgi:hypothetical protein
MKAEQVLSILVLMLVFFCSPVSATTAIPLQCRNNVIALDGAKEQLKIEKSLRTGDEVTPVQLSNYFFEGMFPTCPAGGTYTLGPIGQEPSCSIAEHSADGVRQFIEQQQRRQKAEGRRALAALFGVLLLPLIVYLIARRMMRRSRKSGCN